VGSWGVQEMRSRWAVRFSCGHDCTYLIDPGRSPNTNIGAHCPKCRSEVQIATAVYEGDEPDDGPLRMVSVVLPLGP
jgi:hypothetical protein